MTRNIIRIVLLGLLLATVPAHAQRIAFVDTKYILEKMPEYQSAQQELDKASKEWQKEIDERWAQIGRLREAYNAEAILLTEEMKKSRLEEITKKEQEARDLQQKRFGVGGDLFKKRQELIQPIQLPDHLVAHCLHLLQQLLVKAQSASCRHFHRSEREVQRASMGGRRPLIGQLTADYAQFGYDRLEVAQ